MYRDVMRDFWRGAGERRRLRLALHRLERPLRVRRPPPVRVDQLHHRPRRLHAARPRLLQREAQRGQPRGQPRRHRRQPLLELRRRGGDRRPGDHRAARAPAAQLPRHAAALPGHADAARRRRVRPLAGRQQQRLVPGQRDVLVRLGGDEGGERLLDVHAQLIALRAEHPVFRRRQFLHGHRRGGLRAARRVVVPARRAAHDEGRLGRRRLAAARDVPQRRGDRHARRARPADRRRLVRAAVQRRPRGRASSRCPPQRFGARVGVRAAHGRRRGRDARRRASQSASTSRSLVLLRRTWHDASCAPPTASSSAAGSASRRRASSCPTCATSASATSTSRRRSRRARAPRTATTWSTRRRSPSELGGEREFVALARAAREAGLGLILDIVPNHMATDDANRYWCDPELRRRFFDLDAATGRHRRFFDIDHLAAVRQEDEAVFEETHQLALRARARGRGRRPADRPPGRARRPGRLPAPAARGRRAPRVGGEDPRPRRAAARLARRGHGRLRVPQRRRGAVRRPGRRGAADRAVGGGRGRRAAVPRLRRRGQARAGAHDVRARGRAAPPRGAARGRRAGARARLAAGLPHLRRAVVGAGDRRGPRGDRGGRAAGVARRACCGSRSGAGTRS